MRGKDNESELFKRAVTIATRAGKTKTIVMALEIPTYIQAHTRPYVCMYVCVFVCVVVCVAVVPIRQRSANANINHTSCGTF